MSMDEPADLEACFKQGMQARADGLRISENPHGVRTPEHREWAAGWSATLDLDEDDDAESTRVKPGRTDKDSDPDDDPDLGRLSG